MEVERCGGGEDVVYSFMSCYVMLVMLCHVIKLLSSPPVYSFSIRLFVFLAAYLPTYLFTFLLTCLLADLLAHPLPLPLPSSNGQLYRIEPTWLDL